MPFEAEQHAVPPGRVCCFAGISIYGKLTLYNFSSFIASVEGVTKKTDKYTYTFNHTQVQKICIRYLRGTVKNVKELISRYLVPIRPGRSFERELRRQPADTLAYR